MSIRPVPKHKVGLLSKWANQPRNDAVADEIKRRQQEAWEALNIFISQRGGLVITPPAKMLRIEIPKDSTLPAQLEKLGFNVWHVGANTRLNVDGFLQVDVIEITVSGK